MKEEKEKIMESYDQLFFEKEKEIKNKLDQQQSVFDQQIKDQIETLGQMKRKIKNIVDQQPLILSSNSSLLLLVLFFLFYFYYLFKIIFIYFY